MSNSPLVCYTKLSPFCSPRTAKIDTVSIHCMAGNGSVEGCGALFSEAGKNASSNYGIGSDGRIGLYVPEDKRSWCSSNSANDNRAVTIEVANDGGAPDWHVSDRAMASLVDLLVDICKRNGIPRLLWRADKSLIGQVDKQNMTVHRWFANKACPGDYLYNLHGEIAEAVNWRLLDLKDQETETDEGEGMKPEKLEKLADTLVERVAAKLEDRLARTVTEKVFYALTNDEAAAETMTVALTARVHDRIMQYLLIPANAAAVTGAAQGYLERQAAPPWATTLTEYARAEVEGITDGKRPAAYATRCEAAVMAVRAAEYAVRTLRESSETLRESSGAEVWIE